MPAQPAEVVTGRTFAIVDSFQQGAAAAMIGVAGGAVDIVRVRVTQIAAAEQHVRRLPHSIRTDRIVTPLASQRLDAVAGGMALRALQIDARVMRGNGARRHHRALSPDIQHQRTDESNQR
jgi:hypothetical protein